MKLFIVRDKVTKKFLSPVRAGHSTTAQDLSDVPRTFTKRYAAVNAAVWWAKGMSSTNWHDGEPSDMLYPVEGRDLSTLRIHKIFFALRGPGEKIQ